MGIKSTIRTLLIGWVALGVISANFFHGKEQISILLGFGLFSLNLMLMVFLSDLAVRSTRGESLTVNKFLVFGIGFVKFALLVLGLYLSLIHYKLPGVYLGGGALVALVLVLWGFTTNYLRNLADA